MDDDYNTYPAEYDHLIDIMIGFVMGAVAFGVGVVVGWWARG